MFQTLKAQNGAMGDMEYVIQSSLPAHDKVKAQGQKKQPACTRCKMKKLKCIIESDGPRDGCEKCLESGVACSYRGTRRHTTASSRANSISGSASVESAMMNQSESATTAAGSSKPSPSHNNNNNNNQYPQSGVSQSSSGITKSGSRDSETIHVETCGSNSSSSSSGSGSSKCRTPSQSSQNACSASGLSVMDTVMATPSFMAEMANGPLPPSSFTQEMGLPDLMDETTTFAPGDDLHDYGICFCTDLVIAANATMQVRLVWTTWLDATSTTSSIEDILQCQKNVLASCDTFFKCGMCSLKPDYVVLVISMCREMVAGVQALEHITSPDMLRSRGGQEPLPPPLPLVPQHTHHHHHQHHHHQHHHHHHLDAQQGVGGGASCNSSSLDNNNNSNNNNKPRLQAGGWELDDDDEIEIIRHLIQVRITKLRKLIYLIEHAINERHPSYGWMVGNLRKSLDEKLGSASQRGDDAMTD